MNELVEMLVFEILIPTDGYIVKKDKKLAEQLAWLQYLAKIRPFRQLSQLAK